MKTSSLLLAIVLLASPAASEEFTIATFNAKFLLTDKVHIKYGLRFDLSENSRTLQDEWAPVVEFVSVTAIRNLTYG